MPEPVPGDPEVIEKPATPLDADHWQPGLLAVTVTEPVPPDVANVAFAGLRLYVHTPAWLTLKEVFVIGIMRPRELRLAFGATVKLSDPLPVPDVAEVIEMALPKLLAVAHGQPAPVLMAMLYEPPAAAIDKLEGLKL